MNHVMETFAIAQTLWINTSRADLFPVLQNIKKNQGIDSTIAPPNASDFV